MSGISWVDGDIKFITLKNSLRIAYRTHSATNIGIWLKSASKWNHLQVQSQLQANNKDYLLVLNTYTQFMVNIIRTIYLCELNERFSLKLCEDS